MISQSSLCNFWAHSSHCRRDPESMCDRSCDTMSLIFVLSIESKSHDFMVEPAGIVSRENSVKPGDRSSGGGVHSVISGYVVKNLRTRSPHERNTFDGIA